MGISRTSNKRRDAQRLGRRAEFYCAWHLRAHGYRILTRGFRSPVGAVDLIARRGDVLAFVEVKALSARQRRRIIRAAGNFLRMHPGLAQLNSRFDVMLVTPWRTPIHIIDAWRE